MESSIISKSSFRISLVLVVFAYFAVNCYWMYKTYFWSTSMIEELAVYQKIIKDPWWLATFYSSELGGSIGIVFRFIAGIFALYTATVFLRHGENAPSKVKGKAAKAILFEGLYYVTYIPTVILGFAYPIAASQKLWYFEPSPPWIITFMVAGVSCLMMVAVIMPCLFKLRSKVSSGTKDEIIKWGSITGLSYLFVMFWLNYSIAWAMTLVYWPERAQPGIGILYKPLNLLSFTLTVAGLLIISLGALKVLKPLIRGETQKLNVRSLGAVMSALGAYFLATMAIYYLIGGYYAEPTTWMELSSPFHNPDFWCFSLIFPGIYLLIKGKS